MHRFIPRTNHEELELARFLSRLNILPENVLGHDGTAPHIIPTSHTFAHLHTQHHHHHTITPLRHHTTSYHHTVSPPPTLLGLEAFLTFSPWQLRNDDRARNPDYWYWDLPANNPAKSLWVCAPYTTTSFRIIPSVSHRHLCTLLIVSQIPLFFWLYFDSFASHTTLMPGMLQRQVDDSTLHLHH
jgi:hypothetical protein